MNTRNPNWRENWKAVRDHGVTLVDKSVKTVSSHPYQVLLDDQAVENLMRLGNGNLSEGVWIATALVAEQVDQMNQMNPSDRDAP